jgi:hypothetical protein
MIYCFQIALAVLHRSKHGKVETITSAQHRCRLTAATMQGDAGVGCFFFFECNRSAKVVGGLKSLRYSLKGAIPLNGRLAIEKERIREAVRNPMLRIR